MKTNRYVVAFAGVMFHLMIGSVYAWSVFTHYRNYRANISPVYFYATFGLAQLNRLLISQQQ